jgi:hypothetical protein
MPISSHSALVKALEPSSCAAAGLARRPPCRCLPDHPPARRPAALPGRPPPDRSPRSTAGSRFCATGARNGFRSGRCDALTCPAAGGNSRVMAKSRNRTEQDQAIDIDNARVADAPTDNWVYRVLPRALWPHAQLARWDRPIGWQLLMWPCFWSAALAANVASQSGGWSTAVTIWHLVLFMAGAFLMRGAGCTWNDVTDRHFDGQVERTRSRPIPSGRRHRQTGFRLRRGAGAAGLLHPADLQRLRDHARHRRPDVVTIYPFAKRYTFWPQVFLGSPSTGAR